MLSVCVDIVASSFVVVCSFSKAIMFGGSVTPCECSCLSALENWSSALLFGFVKGLSLDDDDCDWLCVV